jgi:tetratricopeptide (TPR) repeat protein
VKIKALKFLLTCLSGLLLCGSSLADGIGGIARTNRFLDQAEQSMKKKDFPSAIRAYESAFRENPGIPAQAHLNLGSAYYQTGKYSKAMKSYMAAAGLLNNPEQKSQAYLQIGNIYAARKDYKSALDWYKRSLKTQPENKMARFNYELAYRLQKQQEEQESKNNPEKEPPQNPREQDQKKQEQKEKQGDQNKDNKNNSGSSQGNEAQGNQKQNQKDSKQGEDEEKEAKNAIAKKGEKEKGKAKEEQEDKAGNQESKTRGKEETDASDLNAIRLDKEKLQESGLSEDQARALLEAMRQSEVKYLQQRRFKSRKGGNTDSGKPRW